MAVGTWLNEPPRWEERDGVLEIEAAPDSDFWRTTHYGFVRDSGHALLREVAGPFVAEVEFAGEWTTLYDQAGLMVRVDEANWMKCGVEYVDGVLFASAVVTRDFSDWSVCALPAGAERGTVRIRVKREGQSLEVSWALPGGEWTLLRLAYLPMEDAVRIGPMVASPEERGVTVRFSRFEVIPG